ncbi:MAG: DegT/DnrJ/EryC1/StrS family aminotransferase [Planctomycetota bacterium]
MLESFETPRWPPADPEITQAIERLISEGLWARYGFGPQLSNTPEVLEFRDILKSYFEVDVFLVSSAMAALDVCMRTVGIGSGDSVAICAYDYPGILHSVECTGARPVLFDIEDGVPKPAWHPLKESAPDNLRAVVVSHLHGHIADLSELRILCDEHGWLLIEDACQSLGGKIDGAPVGLAGHFSLHSFGGGKLLSAGGGGALVATGKRHAAKIQRYLDRPINYLSPSPLQMVSLTPQWKKLDQYHQRRQLAVEYLCQQNLGEAAVVHQAEAGCDNAYYKLAITYPNQSERDQAIDRANEVNLPLGLPFRSSEKISPKRAVKLGDLQCAAEFSSTTALLDQTFLLQPSAVLDRVVEVLRT